LSLTGPGEEGGSTTNGATQVPGIDCTGTTAAGTGEGELRGTPAGKGTATGPGITANANKAVRHLPS